MISTFLVLTLCTITERVSYLSKIIYRYYSNHAKKCQCRL